MKISALAKELKMKSGKELQEKLKELGFEYKTTSASIEPQAFNKLFASIIESYTEKSISLEDYLEGKAVITEFSGSAAPDTDKKPGKATETKTTEQKSKEKKKTETPDTPAPEKASEATVSKPKSKPAEIKNQSTVSGSTEVKKDVQEKSKAAVGTEPDSKPETKQESKNEPAKEKSAEKQTESKKSSAEVKTAAIKKPESAQSRTESGSQTAGKPEENKAVAKTEKTEPKPLDNKKVSGEVKVPETKKNEPAVKSPDTVKASEPAKATETAKSHESEKTAAATKPVETKKPQQKERTFTPPPQQSKPQKVQQNHPEVLGVQGQKKGKHPGGGGVSVEEQAGLPLARLLVEELFPLIGEIRHPRRLPSSFAGTGRGNGLLTDGADLRQLGIFLDFDAPALVLGQMPVEDVDVVQGHHVDQLLQVVHREVMAAHVNHEATVAI